MSRVERIEEQIRSLTGAELREFRCWLEKYDNQQWDEKFETDVSAGKWDSLADSALADHLAGKSRRL